MLTQDTSVQKGFYSVILLQYMLYILCVLAEFITMQLLGAFEPRDTSAL